MCQENDQLSVAKVCRRLNAMNRFLFTMAALASSSALAFDFEKFDAPKTHFVLTDQASTYAGPSEESYSTGTIRRGEPVEVYGRIGDQWYAIRPPVGQYDWVAAQYAHLLPGGHLAEIIDTPTPAWIHTDDADRDQFLWQVKLQPTQQVNVRGQLKQKLDGGKTRVWYKIDPPPGEFRWLKKDDLAEQPPKIKVANVQALPTKSSLTSLTAEPNEAGSQVQQASGTIVQMNNEPFALAPGEYLVDGDVDGVMSEIQAEYSEGWVEGDSILYDSVSGVSPVVETFGEEAGSCATCGAVGGVAGCLTCGPDLNDRNYRLRPVGKLLSMLGFALVEAERAPEAMPCGSCGLAGCTTCGVAQGITRAGSIGSLPSRLDALPRPTPRMGDSQVDRSLLIDRLGEARENLRESVEDVRETISGSREPLLSGPASVSLGNPLGRRADSTGSATLSSKAQNWQGLPLKGIPSDIPELDIEGPTGVDPNWDRRPVGFTGEIRASTEADSNVRQSSTPNQRDQGNANPAARENDELQFSSALLQQAAAELTSIVSLPTEQWQLHGLHQVVQEWVENGADPIARGEARLLLERIEQFETFRSKWVVANVGRLASVNSQASGLMTSSSMPMVSTAGFQSESSGASVRSVSNVNVAAAKQIIASADASGWLVAVHGENPDLPKYAITDDAGRLVAYVEAIPGLNLRGYLQQPIAIYGQRGMHTLLNMRTIRADKIVRISDAP